MMTGHSFQAPDCLRPYCLPDWLRGIIRHRSHGLYSRKRRVSSIDGIYDYSTSVSREALALDRADCSLHCLAESHHYESY